MQMISPRPADRRDRVGDLAILAETRAVSALAALAARSGIEAALRAIDAGLNTPVIAEPRQ